MLNLLIFCALILIVLALGNRFCKIFTIKEKLSFLEELFISFGLGAGLLALIILCIGLAGLLYKWVILLALAILAVIFIRDLKNIAGDSISWLVNLNKISLKPLELSLVIFLVFVWFLTLIGSLAPILGMDALSYHLRDPKLFIEAHKIIHIPYTRDSLWPFLIQMLFTLGLLLKGPILAKLFHFAFGVFSIAGIYILCRRHWPRANAIMSATIFALIPAIFTGTTYAYTDMAVVFYTLFSFYAFFVWLDKKNNRWLYLAAVSCGFLLGIKITSAVVPGIILFLYFFNILGTEKIVRKKMPPAITFILLIIGVAGVWYLRSWIILGNPIFPFAAYLFGGHGYPEEYLRYQATSGIGTGPVQYVTMLWPLSLYPDRFGGESIGAIFLIFLPLLIFVKKPSRFIKYTMFIAAGLYTSWFIVYQYIRFFYPVLIFLSILVAYVYFEICRKDKVVRKISTIVIILLFCYSAALSVYHNLDKFPVVLGLEKKRDFLLKRERTYGMAEYINKNLPKDSKIIILNEVRLFYFGRDVAVATSVKADMLYNKNIKFRGNFNDYLKQENFNYILYCRDNSAASVPQKFLTPEDFSITKGATLLKQTQFAYRDEKYMYQLWKLEN